MLQRTLPAGFIGQGFPRKQISAPGAARRWLGRRHVSVLPDLRGPPGPVPSGYLLLSILSAAPAAAVCNSPRSICKHIDECLQRTSEPNNKAAEEIKEGVRTRNGKIVWAGAEACARDLGRKKQW